MADFFEELYGLIDGTEHSTRSNTGLRSTLMKLRENASTEMERKAVQWEIYCCDFHLTKGKAVESGSIMDHTGTRQDVYPTFALLDEAAIVYLDERLASSSNPEARARYAQILWDRTGKKQRKYLVAAVDAYFLWLLPKNLSECIGDFFEPIFNLLHLAVSKNHKKEEAKKFFIHLIGLASDHAHILKPKLIEFGLDKKLFDDEYLSILHSDLMQVTAHLREQHSLFSANAIAEVGKKIATKLQMDKNPWLLELGKNHEAFALHRKDDGTGIIPMDSLREAIRQFRRANSEEDITRSTLLYQQLREKVKLNDFSVDLPLDQAQILKDSKDEMVTWYLSHSASEILVYLAHDQTLIPSLQSIKQTEAEDSENNFLRLIRALSFDRNGNISEKDEGSPILNSYALHLGYITAPLLRGIIVDGLRTEKVSVEHWLEYFNLHTWLGKNLERNRHGGVISLDNWIAILAPGLHEFFFQLETSEKLGRPFLNLIQPLDSLTLKAEGLIRDIVLLSGGTTTAPSRNGDMMEKTLEHLLEGESLKQSFSEDELHFFKYVLTREGLNLRNDIAHGFLRFEDYTLDKMLLILLVIIRLSKFNPANVS